MFSTKIDFYVYISIMIWDRKSILSCWPVVLSDMAGSIFRALLHFPNAAHHCAVFTGQDNLSQKNLKHKTKQALIFVKPTALLFFHILKK